MDRRKFLAGIGLVLSLSACAGSAPKGASTTEAVRNAISIRAISVDMSAVGATTKGRPLQTTEAKAILEKALAVELMGKGPGKQPARVVVRISSINIINEGQTIMVGGESVMKGTVSLVDRNGGVLMQPVELSSGGGGWVLGGLMAAAALEDPRTEMRQMSQEFAARARTVIFGL